MFYLMVVVFVLGYLAIALEHPLKIDKAAPALFIGVVTWVLYVLGSTDILAMVNEAGGYVSHAWGSYLAGNPEANTHHGMVDFITHHEVLHHLAEISEILFFLLGAMTIVEMVDQHQGFKVITDRISTTNKVKLLWILSLMTFFMSAALDNLTTTIVLVALLRKLIAEKEDRCLFASMVVLAANAGGAWSPIGDVTTIMLWVKGQVTTVPIISDVILPSLVTMLAPLLILTFRLKGEISRPADVDEEEEFTTARERVLILVFGVCALLFVPVFKTVTHLPPYMGMLFGLSLLWATTEIMHRNKHHSVKKKLTVSNVIGKVDIPTVMFFLGILSAVAALQSAGHLGLLAQWLDETTGKNIYLINLVIGVLSSIVDNVPLVAGAMGMYDIAPAGSTGNLAMFVQDGQFWQFLAYCAGTGGSILIIGSAAGVAAMGMEKIDFIWYMKKISILAFIGYLAGAGVYYIEAMFFLH